MKIFVDTSALYSLMVRSDNNHVDRDLHQDGIAAVLTANRRQLSLVDCISFEVCRQRSIDRIFTFDPHFWEQGFLPVYYTSGDTVQHGGFDADDK